MYSVAAIANAMVLIASSRPFTRSAPTPTAHRDNAREHRADQDREHEGQRVQRAAPVDAEREHEQRPADEQHRAAEPGEPLPRRDAPLEPDPERASPRTGTARTR